MNYTTVEFSPDSFMFSFVCKHATFGLYLIVFCLHALQKGVVKKHQRERSLSPEKLLLYIHARAVRVGTFCSTPIEPIKFSDERIHFHLRGTVDVLII